MVKILDSEKKLFSATTLVSIKAEDKPGLNTQVFFFFLFFLTLRIELRASWLLGKCSTS
jgi:hypothetical protein